MKYRFQGTIKAIKFTAAKGYEKVSVLLENTTFMSNEGDWKQWVDLDLVKSGNYKKGDVWVSAFEQSAPQVFQACKMIEKGSEVELEIYKGDKDFLNINNMNLKVPEKDINEDLEPPSEKDEKRMAEEPSSDQRPEDSPEAQADKLVEEQTRVDDTPAPSTTVDRAVSKDVTIGRLAILKAVCSAFKIEGENDAKLAIVIAKMFEGYAFKN